MGSVRKSVATLRIFGDDLVPEQVSSQLGCSPTASRQKGDTIVGGRTGALGFPVMRIWRSFVIGFTLARVLSGQAVLVGRASSEYRENFIKMDASSFTEGSLVQLAQAELRRKPRVNFVHTYMSPTGGSLLPKPDHYNYASWRQINEQYLSSRMEVGELIAIGANAVLRFRDIQGQITKRIIRGQDPLLIDMQGDSFEIVHITSAEVGTFLEIYLRTRSTLSAQMGANALHTIERMLPDFHVSIYLRNDGLFIYEPRFPYLNPFQDEPTIPSEEEYRQTKTLKCSWISGCNF